MKGRVLIAGIGNIFFGDDGFGCEVARRLTMDPPQDGVLVKDFGIAGMHLAYELVDGYDLAILIDAIETADPPGTLSVIEPQVGEAAGPADAHSMDPRTVLAQVHAMDGATGRYLLVGCRPANTDEGIGLSPVVEAVVDDAVAQVRALIAAELASPHQVAAAGVGP
ncbi:MAG: hydrogenase maturation protease [Candidatus Limnocylindrales bacterium]